jgi:hypothetical protein
MILRETVFVLGAGASQPYDFPPASELMTNIRVGISAGHNFRQDLLQCGFNQSHLREFADALEHEDRYSLDAFLETHPKFLKVGKAAIALSLVPKERDSYLTPARHEGWHRYLFDQMLQGAARGESAAKTFVRNRLSVVTFNFDRSFERALYLFLKRTITDEVEKLKALTLHVPVLHIHGDLGKPAWLEGDQNGSRPYGDPHTPDIRDIRLCAERIRLVSDEIADDDPTVLEIRAKLKAAAEVVFIGFAYEHRDLQRLSLSALNRPYVALRGTNYGMTSGNSARAMTTLKGLQLVNAKAHQFVTELPMLHDVLD